MSGKTMSRLNGGRAAVCAALVSMLAWSPVQADQIKVSMTVDNSYALFAGTVSAATTFYGADYNWGGAETYTFDLGSSAYLYVVTASDRSVAQGFLGMFENVTSGYKFYSQDEAWQVTATGLGGAGAPYSGSSADLGLLSGEIVNANAGTNASQGWQAFTAGGSNGSGPWGMISGIDSDARWVWYGGGNCDTNNPTLGGCDAGEWLVFRIAVAATPDNPIPDPDGGNGDGTVPEPTSLALTMLGLALAAGVRRRRS